MSTTDVTIERARRGKLWKYGGLVLVLLLSFGFLAWWCIQRNEIALRRALVERIRAAGGAVSFQHQYNHQDDLNPSRPAEPFPKPNFLRRWLLGRDSLLRIHAVRFPNGVEVDRRSMHLLQRLDEARALLFLGTLLRDDMLREISHLRQLRFLAIQSTNVTNKGLRWLCDMPQMRVLNVCRLPVTDPALTQMERIPNLRHLAAYDTWVSSRGIDEFQNRCPRTEVVWSNPRDESQRKALVHLDQVGFTVSRDQRPGDAAPVYRVASEFFHLGSALTSKNWLANDSDLEVLPRIPGVVELSLNVLPGYPRFTDAAMPSIGATRSLQKLDLSGTAITDNGLAELTDLRHLQILDLSQTAIDSRGVSHLAKIRSLTELRLFDTCIDNHALRFLKALPNLTVLDVADTRIDEQSINDFGGFALLKELDVRGNGFSEGTYQRLRALLRQCKIK